MEGPYKNGAILSTKAGNLRYPTDQKYKVLIEGYSFVNFEFNLSLLMPRDMYIEGFPAYADIKKVGFFGKKEVNYCTALAGLNIKEFYMDSSGRFFNKSKFRIPNVGIQAMRDMSNYVISMGCTPGHSLSIFEDKSTSYPNLRIHWYRDGYVYGSGDVVLDTLIPMIISSLPKWLRAKEIMFVVGSKISGGCLQKVSEDGETCLYVY